MARSRQTQPDRAAVLRDTREKAVIELEALRHQHDRALDELLQNGAPDDGILKVDDLKARMRTLAARIETIDELVAKAEDEVRLAAIAARRTAAADDELATAAIANDMPELAAAFDAAIAATILAASEYAARGDRCSAHANRAMVCRHGPDTSKLHDELATAGPRYLGRGADVAVAVAQSLRRVVLALGLETDIDMFVSFNRFTPKSPATLQEAAQLNLKIITERFDGRQHV